MATKTTKFNKAGIEKLPNDKPVLYRVQSASGRTNYAGIAQRGRVQDRLGEHLRDGMPGEKVQIEQMPSIGAARAKETRVIARSKPKYNKQGK